MFNFGEFYEINEDQANFSVWELALFILIGSLGGLVGAATVHASTALTHRRMKQNPQEKQREVLAVALVMSLVSFLLPLWLGKCTLKPDPEDVDAAYTSQVILTIIIKSTVSSCTQVHNYLEHVFSSPCHLFAFLQVNHLSL